MTLFISKTTFYRTGSIMRHIPSFMLNVGNITQNTVSPGEHCYGSEWCYVECQTGRLNIRFPPCNDKQLYWEPLKTWLPHTWAKFYSRTSRCVALSWALPTPPTIWAVPLNLIQLAIANSRILTFQVSEFVVWCTPYSRRSKWRLSSLLLSDRT